MEPPRLFDGLLKIRHLVLVDALTRQGSVVGAAAALHVTQPVATRCLHEIEEILGVTLYERGPRGVTPTVFGHAFTEHARAVLAQVAEAGRHIDELADASRGTVVVGALPLPKTSSVQVMRHARTRGGCCLGDRVGVCSGERSCRDLR
ncbi:LysR family transcriptional regulator [Saccharopolyspora sp. 5N102]|uniref:LysR family transcriptional regulator n=1 Tax=Saccharopolyspora sp. 5N102 TaxID=3375155 RepID=UPI0037A278CF